MERTLTNEQVKKIMTIEKMYHKQNVRLRIEENSIKIMWNDSNTTQESKIKGKRMQHKLDVVSQILGDRFIEFYWLNGDQMVYARY